MVTQLLHDFHHSRFLTCCPYSARSPSTLHQTCRFDIAIYPLRLEFSTRFLGNNTTVWQRFVYAAQTKAQDKERRRTTILDENHIEPPRLDQR